MARWLRAPDSVLAPENTRRFGITEGSATNQSYRFLWGSFGGIQIRTCTMQKRLAYIAWHLNAIQRWFGNDPTVFKLRDRMTQAQYDLDTEPAEWEPTEPFNDPANLETLIDLITAQFETGGPSGLGAHRFYIHEFMSQAREVAAEVAALLWVDDEIHLHGAVYGCKWDSDVIPGIEAPYLNRSQGIPSWGATYPTTPDSATVKDSTDWPFQTEDPPFEDWYMDVDRLKPSTEHDWASEKYERLPKIKGTTLNANHYPPDLFMLQEFRLMPHHIPWFLRGKKNFKQFDVFGTQVSESIYENDPLAAASDNLPPPNIQPLQSYALFTQGAYPHDVGWAEEESREQRRVGFWEEFTGKVWASSLWNWISYRMACEPETMKLAGTLSVSFHGIKYGAGTVAGTASYHIKLFAVFSDDDELELADLDDEMTQGGDVSDPVDRVQTRTVDYDVDITDKLQNCTRFELELRLEDSDNLEASHINEDGIFSGLWFYVTSSSTGTITLQY